jgi:hypothetical protein
MTPEITAIAPRLKPRAPLVGEPTSTFGDEAVDQAVEDMVVKLTHALMNSDHVEDVFAEDAVIRRDIFRVVRDGLREPPGAGEEHAGHVSVTVKLDALGYVAATASRRADPATLRMALDRAASVTHARFSGFSPELREATFRLEGAGQDERLEIEEAVADELTDLVEQGLVELPTIERRFELSRPLPAAEQRALRARIEAAADATLGRAGCVASWEVEGQRTLRVLFTPLSDHDARAVDAPANAFAREVALLVEREGPRAEEAAAQKPAPPPASPRPRSRPEDSSHDGAARGSKPRPPAEPKPSRPARAEEAEASKPSRPARAKKAAEPEPAPEEEPAKPARKATKATAAKPAKTTGKRAATESAEGSKPHAATKTVGATKRAAAAATKATKAPAKKR